VWQRHRATLGSARFSSVAVPSMPISSVRRPRVFAMPSSRHANGSKPLRSTVMCVARQISFHAVSTSGAPSAPSPRTQRTPTRPASPVTIANADTCSLRIGITTKQRGVRGSG
jgi:hypothetical protein